MPTLAQAKKLRWIASTMGSFTVSQWKKVLKLGEMRFVVLPPALSKQGVFGQNLHQVPPAQDELSPRR